MLNYSTTTGAAQIVFITHLRVIQNVKRNTLFFKCYFIFKYRHLISSLSLIIVNQSIILMQVQSCIIYAIWKSFILFQVSPEIQVFGGRWFRRIHSATSIKKFGFLLNGNEQLKTSGKYNFKYFFDLESNNLFMWCIVKIFIIVSLCYSLRNALHKKCNGKAKFDALILLWILKWILAICTLHFSSGRN